MQFWKSTPFSKVESKYLIGHPSPRKLKSPRCCVYPGERGGPFSKLPPPITWSERGSVRARDLRTPHPAFGAQSMKLSTAGKSWTDGEERERERGIPTNTIREKKIHIPPLNTTILICIPPLCVQRSTSHEMDSLSDGPDWTVFMVLLPLDEQMKSPERFWEGLWGVNIHSTDLRRSVQEIYYHRWSGFYFRGRYFFQVILWIFFWWVVVCVLFEYVIDCRLDW